MLRRLWQGSKSVGQSGGDALCMALSQCTGVVSAHLGLPAFPSPFAPLSGGMLQGGCKEERFFFSLFFQALAYQRDRAGVGLVSVRHFLVAVSATVHIGLLPAGLPVVGAVPALVNVCGVEHQRTPTVVNPQLEVVDPRGGAAEQVVGSCRRGEDVGEEDAGAQNAYLDGIGVGTMNPCHGKRDGKAVDRVGDVEPQRELVDGKGTIIVVEDIPSAGLNTARAAVVGRQLAVVEGDVWRAALDGSRDVVHRCYAEGVGCAAQGAHAVVDLDSVERGDGGADADSGVVFLPLECRVIRGGSPMQVGGIGLHCEQVVRVAAAHHCRVEPYGGVGHYDDGERKQGVGHGKVA